MAFVKEEPLKGKWATVGECCSAGLNLCEKEAIIYLAPLTSWPKNQPVSSRLIGYRGPWPAGLDLHGGLMHLGN